MVLCTNKDGSGIIMALFYLSVWLIGQVVGSSAIESYGPQFDSWQFTAQAEKWCWIGN